MLVPFVDGVWTVTRPQRFLGFETGSRMTVVKLASGGLFVHSPVALDAETRAAVDALGEVRAVVSPSLFHHLHVGPWMAAYPKAHFAACPALEWKRRDLAWHSVMADQPHPIWAGEIEQVYFSSRRENEVDFYLPRAKLMICCDAMLNLGTHPDTVTRIGARLMGNTAPGVSHLEPAMVRDRGLARRQVDRILAWDFDGVVLAHGDMLPRDGREAVRRAYAWL